MNVRKQKSRQFQCKKQLCLRFPKALADRPISRVLGNRLKTNDISRELLHYSVTKYHFLQLSPLEVPTTNESTFTIRKKNYSVTNRMTFLATVTGTGLPNQKIGVNTSY